MVRLLVDAVLVLAATWLAFLVLVAVVRPRGIDLAEAKRLVPDIARLLRDLARDPTLPRGVRRRLVFLVGYLALPFDVVPDFIPILGYADDVALIGLVLRSVVRRAGPDAVDRHWRGTPQGLALVRRLGGIR